MLNNEESAEKKKVGDYTLMTFYISKGMWYYLKEFWIGSDKKWFESFLKQNNLSLNWWTFCIRWKPIIDWVVLKFKKESDNQNNWITIVKDTVLETSNAISEAIVQEDLTLTSNNKSKLNETENSDLMYILKYVWLIVAWIISLSWAGFYVWYEYANILSIAKEKKVLKELRKRIDNSNCS